MCHSSNVAEVLFVQTSAHTWANEKDIIIRFAPLDFVWVFERNAFQYGNDQIHLHEIMGIEGIRAPKMYVSVPNDIYATITHDQYTLQN